MSSVCDFFQTTNPYLSIPCYQIEGLIQKSSAFLGEMIQKSSNQTILENPWTVAAASLTTLYTATNILPHIWKGDTVVNGQITGPYASLTGRISQAIAIGINAVSLHTLVQECTGGYLNLAIKTALTMGSFPFEHPYLYTGGVISLSLYAAGRLKLLG